MKTHVLLLLLLSAPSTIWSMSSDECIDHECIFEMDGFESIASSSDAGAYSFMRAAATSLISSDPENEAFEEKIQLSDEQVKTLSELYWPKE